MAAADNVMLWATWGVTQLHERIVKFNNNVVRGRLRDALLGDVFHYDRDRGQGQAVFNDQLYSQVIVKDGEYNKNFEDLVETHFGPAIKDLADMLEQVIGEHDHVIFGKLGLVPANTGASAFRCDYDNISLRVTAQYDSYKQGIVVTFDILVAAYTFESGIPGRDSDITSGTRKPDAKVTRESGRVDSSYIYQPKPTSDAKWDHKSGKWSTPKGGDITIPQAELNKMLADARKSASVKEEYAKGAAIAKAVQKRISDGTRLG